MKTLLLALSFCIASAAMAQADSLPSGIYNPDSFKVRKQSLEGSTTDLKRLQIHTSTLGPGQVNHPPRALNDVEELIVVKNGLLTLTINDTTKTLSPGSVTLIIAGDQQSFRNASDKPATYIVLSFRSTSPVNIARGKTGGGSMLLDWSALTVKKTDKGASRPVFDRPSSMFERFEVHATTLNTGFESHPPHTHREEEIMLLMKGNVTLRIGEALYHAVAGDVMLMRPNVLHNVKNTGNEQCWYLAVKWYTAGK